MVKVLNVDRATFGYINNDSKDESLVLKDLSFSLKEGQLVCLMGANGCGKSTLIKTIAGILSPISGKIEILEKKINQLNPPDLSRLVSVVLTDRIFSPHITVKELISLGRYPYLDFFARLTKRDIDIIDEVVSLMGLEELVGRAYDELSDGQKQKVLIARAVVQDTPLMILDEPTTFLDIPSRMEIIHLLRKISIQKKKAILFSSHDWDLALEMISKVWLITQDGLLIEGMPEDLILQKAPEQSFGGDKFYFDQMSGSFKAHPIDGLKLKLNIDQSMKSYWTYHALKKEGFGFSEDSQIIVSLYDELWKIEHLGKIQTFESIECLVMGLYSLTIR